MLLRGLGVGTGYLIGGSGGGSLWETTGTKREKKSRGGGSGTREEAAKKQASPTWRVCVGLAFISFIPNY